MRGRRSSICSYWSSRSAIVACTLSSRSSSTAWRAARSTRRSACSPSRSTRAATPRIGPVSSYSPPASICRERASPSARSSSSSVGRGLPAFSRRAASACSSSPTRSAVVSPTTSSPLPVLHHPISAPCPAAAPPASVSRLPFGRITAVVPLVLIELLLRQGVVLVIRQVFHLLRVDIPLLEAAGLEDSPRTAVDLPDVVVRRVPVHLLGAVLGEPLRYAARRLDLATVDDRARRDVLAKHRVMDRLECVDLVDDVRLPRLVGEVALSTGLDGRSAGVLRHLQRRGPAALDEWRRALLDDVDELVRDELLPATCLGRVGVRAEEDRVPDREGARAQRSVERGRAVVGVHPHAGEVRAEFALHWPTQLVRQA